LLDEDPASEAGAVFDARWLALEDRSSDGDKGIKAALERRGWSRQNWPAKDRQRIEQFNVEKIADFIGRGDGPRA